MGTSTFTFSVCDRISHVDVVADDANGFFLAAEIFGDFFEGVVAKDVGIADQLDIVIDEVRELRAEQKFDGEDFLDAFFEFAESDCFAGFDVYYPDATGTFFEPFDERNAAENG